MSPRTARPSEGDTFRHNGYDYEVASVEGGKLTLVRPEGEKAVDGFGATVSIGDLNDVRFDAESETYSLAGRLPPDVVAAVAAPAKKAAAKKRPARR